MPFNPIPELLKMIVESSAKQQSTILHTMKKNGGKYHPYEDYKKNIPY
jgi:hypothetical protein